MPTVILQGFFSKVEKIRNVWIYQNQFLIWTIRVMVTGDSRLFSTHVWTISKMVSIATRYEEQTWLFILYLRPALWRSVLNESLNKMYRAWSINYVHIPTPPLPPPPSTPTQPDLQPVHRVNLYNKILFHFWFIHYLVTLVFQASKSRVKYVFFLFYFLFFIECQKHLKCSDNNNTIKYTILIWKQD